MLIIFAVSAELATAITALVSAILIGGGPILINFLRHRKDSKKEEKETEHRIQQEEKETRYKIEQDQNTRAFEMQKEMFSSLKADYIELKNELKKLDHDHLHCREENAALSIKCDIFTKQIEVLTKRVAELEAQSSIRA